VLSFVTLLIGGCSDEHDEPKDSGAAEPTNGSADGNTGLPSDPSGEGGATAGDGGFTDRDAASSDGGSSYPREACELVPATSADGTPGTLALKVEVVAQGLEIPWGLAWLSNGDMLITERPGRLRRIRGGQLESTPVLEVDVAIISILEELGLGSEGGLLGVLLHPDFDANRLFYLYYTARRADNALINRLGLYKMSEDGSNATFERFLLDDIPGGIHHQGGRMQIGPDGKLYVGVGAYDPGLAQKPDELAGKLLRLNVDGTVPNDNPTPGSFVFLTGIRNTQGYDWFDRNHLFVMDHGPTSVDPGVPEKGWDEFNVARAGENLGWPEVLGCNTAAGVTEPALVWERSLPPGGAAIYRGTAIPEWKGSFLVATLGLAGSGEGEHLHRIQVSPDNPYSVQKHEVYLKGEYGRLRTVAMGPDGHLYLTTSNCDSRGAASGRCLDGGDKVLRIVGTN
jgi:glucose/arabinose dehydrogenase